jgi:hypothetical protein
MSAKYPNAKQKKIMRFLTAFPSLKRAICQGRRADYQDVRAFSLNSEIKMLKRSAIFELIFTIHKLFLEYHNIVLRSWQTSW